MYYTKLFIILASILLLGFNIPANKPYSTKWVITKGCSLKVDGRTNVNTFSCVIADYSIPDTLILQKTTSADPVTITGCLKLDVINFDCKNAIMTKDLRKTLKQKSFPKLIIRFVNLSKYPDFKNRGDIIKGLVNIELAGVSKRFIIDYLFKQDGSTSFSLVGTRQVRFSDFNIVPPRKLGGMIQTDDELKVEFNLNVKIIN
ncbi:MAG: hypothetical protein JWQ25_340 [Daejeonella sp.]|nr:hypothetical protein [Daejeonella sp.]